ncbi:MAG: hypothetical protein ACRDZO_14785 [Egibacteraceae bacterium]
MSDFEERLRQALDDQASKVTPDPATWRKVESRAQRGSAFRLGAPAVGTATVALIIVITASRIFAGPDIRPVDRVEATRRADAPETAFAPETHANPDPGPCATRGGMAAVIATTLGRLEAACRTGGMESLTSGPGFDAHPVIGYGRVLFDRRQAPDAPPYLVELDLATGQVDELWPGAWPAVGPDGQIAAIVDEPGDGRQPEIEVVMGDEVIRFPVFTQDAPELTARHLAFDPAGDRVYWEAGYEGSTVWTATLEQQSPIQLQDATTTDARLAAPASAQAGAVGMISRCCVAVEGDRPTSAHLIVQSQRGTIGQADLAGLQGFDLGAPELFLSPGGQMTLDEQGRWVPAQDPTWIVGDGERLFVVGDRDPIALISRDAVSAAVVATLEPPP